MLLQDIRYALRTLLRNPGFTVVAVACMALGIGVNATIFSVVDGVIINPHPYPQADRLIVVHATNQRLGVQRTGLSYQDFRDVQEQASTLAAAGAFTGRSLTISDQLTEPERYSGLTVSWTLFDLLGERPAIGRGFQPHDDRPGAEPVVLLSDDIWKNRYAADPRIVGQAISINGRSHTVIGVMAPRFAFPENQRLWVPLAPYAHDAPRDDRNLQVIARVKPDVTLEQARADLAGVASRLAEAYPAQNENWTAGARPIREWMLPAQVHLVLLTMMGAVTLVLLIACANVANLLLARASVRQREIAVRSALGAGRWRIVRQLLTEAITIGLLSAPLGLLVAWMGIRLLDGAMPQDSVPYFIYWSLNARALAYTLALSMLTGIVFGLAPAVQAARGNLQETLKDGGRGHVGGRGRLRSALVVAEVGLSLMLLVGASLFVRSFLNLQASTVGFDTAPLMTMRFYLPGVQYDGPEPKAQRVEDIVRRVEALPGVEAAFASNFVPLAGGGSGGQIEVEGRSVEKGQEPSIAFVATTPHLQRTLNVPMVLGRDFTDAEGATRTPVAVINQAMARRVWPDEDPIGRRFRLTRSEDWFTVVGVITDFRHFAGTNTDPPFPAAYVPYPVDPTLNTGLTVRVASGDPARITASVREQIRQSDATLPVFQVRSMEEQRQLSFWQFRLFGWMFAVFGAVALVLASIGVYGVLSYSVAQRTPEIGVRMALGAGRRQVLRLIVGHGLKLAAAGVVLGLIGAFGTTHVVKTLLYNVTPTDPVSFAGVALFLTVVALVASYLPARRAMAVDPIIALRNE